MHVIRDRLWWGSLAAWSAIFNGMIEPITSLLVIELLAYVALRRYVAKLSA
jgi:hypothetical protein